MNYLCPSHVPAVAADYKALRKILGSTGKYPGRSVVHPLNSRARLRFSGDGHPGCHDGGSFAIAASAPVDGRRLHPH